MHRYPRATALLAIPLVLLSACQDQRASITQPSPFVRQGLNEGGSAISATARSIPGFAVTITVIDTPTLGLPFRVMVHVSAFAPAPDAHVTITVPELQLALAGGGVLNLPTRNWKAPALLDHGLAMSEGQEVDVPVTLLETSLSRVTPMRISSALRV